MTVAITGATGLIGGALAERLTASGHRVRRIVRAASASRPGDVQWDPARGVLDQEGLEGVDAIVHLAGEPVAHRWTSARKRAIRDSRVQGTVLLARAVSSMRVKPRVVLSGSAIGYYGDRGDELLDERSASGTDFLAGVAREWEGAAAPMEQVGVRVVLLRTGIVLTPHGGALGKLLVPFRLGVGGPLGNGRQWMSWISLHDHLRAMEHALVTEALYGPANFTAPSPVRNAEFAATLGRVLERPALVRVPAFALELLYGEMADATLLAGQRAEPRALLSAGFHFEHPTLDVALKAEL